MTLSMACFALAIVLLATAWWLRFTRPAALVIPEIEPAPPSPRNSWYRITGSYPRVVAPNCITGAYPRTVAPMREELPTLEWHPGLGVSTDPAGPTESL